MRETCNGETIIDRKHWQRETKEHDGLTAQVSFMRFIMTAPLDMLQKQMGIASPINLLSLSLPPSPFPSPSRSSKL